jgi:hypothetical protein
MLIECPICQKESLALRRQYAANEFQGWCPRCGEMSAVLLPVVSESGKRVGKAEATD